MNLIKEYMKEICFTAFSKDYDGYKEWYDLTEYFYREQYLKIFRYCLEETEVTLSDFEKMANKIIIEHFEKGKFSESEKLESELPEENVSNR